MKKDLEMPVKILVADDSTTDRMIIRNMLSEYIVLTACGGAETMRVLEENDGIDLLILDLNMPDIDGFQVLESIRGDERFRKLRTIILTNYDELDNEIRGLKLGAVDYIRKPVHMDSLKVRIDIHVALLRAERALEQRLDEQMTTFDLLFNQAPIGIAIYDGLIYSGKPSAQINSMYEQIVGRTKEEVIQLG